MSVSAAWIEAIRNGPCLRIGTATLPLPRLPSSSASAAEHRVAEQALGLLDAALEVADRVDLRQVHAERHQRLRDLAARGR